MLPPPTHSHIYFIAGRLESTWAPLANERVNFHMHYSHTEPPWGLSQPKTPCSTLWHRDAGWEHSYKCTQIQRRVHVEGFNRMKRQRSKHAGVQSGPHKNTCGEEKTCPCICVCVSLPLVKMSRCTFNILFSFWKQKVKYPTNSTWHLVKALRCGAWTLKLPLVISASHPDNGYMSMLCFSHAGEMKQTSGHKLSLCFTSSCEQTQWFAVHPAELLLDILATQNC